jgi:hypothetical protein
MSVIDSDFYSERFISKKPWGQKPWGLLFVDQTDWLGVFVTSVMG